jgi:hypothetical protein
MAAEITHLADRRKPVVYTIEVTHFWDGTVEVFVHDVADDERTREAVCHALSLTAKALAGGGSNGE